MKIIFLQKTTKFSGAESIVITLMKLLKSFGYNVYYLSPDGPIRKNLEKEGLNFIPLTTTNPFLLKKTIKRLKPDIIHATDYSMSVMAAFLFGRKIPVISHLHNNPLWLKKRFHPNSIMYALALPRISWVVTVSDSIVKEYCYSFLMSKKTTKISNIVDIDKVRSLAKRECAKDDLYDLAFLGRMEFQKNPLLFCEIVKHLKEKRKNIKAVMIGEGSLRNQVENFISENELEQNLFLCGFKRNPYVYLQASKVGVMPSRFEGFGLAAVEMMALGKPVLCSNVGGLTEVVNNNCGKICFSLNDYINEAEKLLNDKKYYNKKSANAKKESLKFNDLLSYRNKFIQIYMRSTKHE